MVSKGSDLGLKKKQGRPKLNYCCSIDEFHSYLRLKFNDAMKMIEKNHKETHERTDIMRTALIRVVKKISYYGLVKVNAKADYKSARVELY